MKKILAVVATTAWISISEFARNQFFLEQKWKAHYQSLGQVFPAAPLNGAVWGIWALCFSIFILFISRKFNYISAVLLSWFVAFPMMWLVLWNLLVLPVSILPVAVPLSLLEVGLAVWLTKKIAQ